MEAQDSTTEVQGLSNAEEGLSNAEEGSSSVEEGSSNAADLSEQIGCWSVPSMIENQQTQSAKLQPTKLISAQKISFS